MIIYEIELEDPKPFFDYFVSMHMPLLWGFPGIRAFKVMRGDGEDDVFLIGRLIFNTVDDLRAPISGGYRAVTRSDMDNFSAYPGTVRWAVAEDCEFEGP